MYLHKGSVLTLLYTGLSDDKWCPFEQVAMHSRTSSSSQTLRQRQPNEQRQQANLQVQQIQQTNQQQQQQLQLLSQQNLKEQQQQQKQQQPQQQQQQQQQHRRHHDHHETSDPQHEPPKENMQQIAMSSQRIQEVYTSIQTDSYYSFLKRPEFDSLKQKMALTITYWRCTFENLKFSALLEACGWSNLTSIGNNVTDAFIRMAVCKLVRLNRQSHEIDLDRVSFDVSLLF